METWGELFWDAWIRLRLACRRLYRTYWPPHLKTWQVCTATGVVSIILTLVVLNLPSSKSDLQAKNDEPASTASKPSKTSAAQAAAAIAESDPFAEPDLTESSSETANEDGAAPFQPESLDSDYAEPIVNGPRRTEVAAADFAATEAPDQGLPSSESGTDRPVLSAPADDDTQPAMSAADVDSVGSELEVGTEPAASETESDIEMPAELTLPPETDEPPVAAEPVTAAQPPVLELPDRDPGHYGRFGDEKGEDQQPTDNIRVTRIKDLPPAKQHTPFVTPIRPKSNYSRFGHYEDSEEDRHSIRDIRPTRTDSVPIPGGSVVIQSPKDEPAETASQPTSPALELPPVPMDPASPEPTGPTTTEADQGNGFELPSTESIASDRTADELPSTEPPPVLFAPETAVDPAEAHGPVPRHQPDSHGPVRSTKSTDHEAHQEEDEFSLPARQTTPTAKVVPPAGPEEPVETEQPKPVDVKSTEPADHEAHQEEDEFSIPPRKTSPAANVAPPAVEDQPVSADERTPVDVKSTEPADHEAHQEEDAFSRPVRKTIPEARIAPPAVEEQPAEAETRKPASDDAAEINTAPRTPRRTTPHIVHDYDEATAAPDTAVPQIDEDQVPPVSVTRPRNSERVTIPERIPAEALPVEPVLPLGRDDSEFTPAATTGKPSDGPRLVMEITGPRQVPVGTQVVLHFKLQNVGSTPATGIVVTDVLPPGLQHRLSSDLEYTVSRLNPGETRETNLTVQCVAPGTIINKAALRADGDVTAQAEIQLEVMDATAGSSTQPRTTQSPLTINHHGPERWLVDSTGQFLVTVTNTGSQALKNVTISQTYPSGTNLLHATVGHKTDAKQRIVSWTISEFAPGVSYILETELHSLTSGPATSIARIKVGDTEVAEDRWTAVSYSATANVPASRR